MNRTERHEEHLIEAAPDNAYDSNFSLHRVDIDQLELDLEYPPIERSRELIQSMLDNPELNRKLGKLTIEGVEDGGI